MRLGCCGSIEQAQIIHDAGFDFLEVNVQQVLKGKEPSDVWDKQAPDVDRLPLRIEAANSLIPGDMPIIGPNRDMGALQDYMQRVAKRAQRLGIERMVFGSGKARMRPEGVSQEQAMNELIEFTDMAGQICGHHDVLLVIEHLNFPECNTINMLDDTRRLCDAVNSPHVQGLVDSYHWGLMKDTDQAILDLGQLIRHVHIAEPDGRGEPGKPAHTENAFDFESFFCVLRKAGYSERVSIEAKWTGPLQEKAPAAVELIRKAWDAAGKCES